MNQPSDPQDEQWLAAVSGRPDPNASAKVNRQALAVREALRARAKQLDDDTPVADQALFEQTLFRLRREGLLERRPIWKSPAALAVAATIGLTVAIVPQLRFGSDEGTTVVPHRVESFATVLVAADPRKRTLEIVSALLPSTGIVARGSPTETAVEEIGAEQFKITIEATQDALDYLESQGISATVVDGKIVLLIKPE